jgi:hypothetical protein
VIKKEPPLQIPHLFPPILKPPAQLVVVGLVTAAYVFCGVGFKTGMPATGAGMTEKA